MADNPSQLELELTENNTPNAQQPQMERAPSTPPWFGPHAILEAVERLVVSDNPNADAGCTFEEIKVSLMQRHTIQEEELALDLDATLRVRLARLLYHTGDLKLVGLGVSGEEHYMLSPPYLPPWFRPKLVLYAVAELDCTKDGGWIWEEIRSYLKREHQPDQPLPPDFDTVLRAMLSVLRHKGHLTWGDRGKGHYTRRQAPALVEPNTIHIPGYLWCYYLGYKLGVGDGLDDDDSDEEAANNNPNVPSWFGPGTVLEEMLRLCIKQFNNANTGWTLEKIRDSLKQTHHKDDKLPWGLLDTTLRATLATLSNRGYLRTKEDDAGQRYTVSTTPPASFFPKWFRPEAVLQAVGELDDGNSNDDGSTSDDIRRYFVLKHGLILLYPAWFTTQLQMMLSVLRQRGHLRMGASGPKHYTRRDAPATGTAIGIPDDYLLYYYAGYKLGSGYILDDGEEVDLFKQAPNSGLRRRRNISSPIAEMEPLLTPSRSRADDDERTNVEDKKKEKSSRAPYKGWFGWWHGIPDRDKGRFESAPTDIESPPVPPSEEMEAEEQRKQQQRKLYMKWSMGLSLCGHALLIGLSFIHVLGEKTSGHHEQETSKRWLKWGVMNLVVPLPLLAAMFYIHNRFFIDIEETSADARRAKWKKNSKSDGDLLVEDCVRCNQRSAWPKHPIAYQCAYCRFPDRFGWCPLPLGEAWLPRPRIERIVKLIEETSWDSPEINSTTSRG